MELAAFVEQTYISSATQNTSDKIPNISDFPYPIGSKTKVSLPLKNDNMASSCFTFRLQLSNGKHALEPLYGPFQFP